MIKILRFPTSVINFFECANILLFFTYRSIYYNNNYFVFCYTFEAYQKEHPIFMKKYILIFVSLITIVSCGDDVEFNDITFEGLRNGEFLWRGGASNVSFDANGFLTISGSNGTGDLSLTIPGGNVGIYTLGTLDNTNATYQENGISYATFYDGSGGPAQQGDGEVEIEEVDLVRKTFTGTFKFNAYDASGDNVVNFSQGRFFNVPLTSGDFPTVILTCPDAQMASQTALSAYQDTFIGVDVVDAQAYQDACMLYKQALEDEQAFCGDDTGSLQDIIDGLGDCTLPCNLAEANSAYHLAQLNAATIGTYGALCNTYEMALQDQITFCGDADSSIQALLDVLDCDDEDGDGVPNRFEDTNDDGDYLNDDSDNDGIPDYQDTDDDNDGFSTAEELQLDEDGNPLDSDGDAAANYLDRDDDNDGLFTVNETGDTDGDGVLNYLDNDDDGDGILTQFENPDINADGNSEDAQDTDDNGTADYLDVDDDGDGLLTANENADPNGDGNPDDAVDTDGDMIPDYLDNM